MDNTALKRTRSKLNWIKSLGGGVASGLRLAYGILYLVDGNGYLRAIDAQSGVSRWSNPSSFGGLRVHNQVAVDDGLVVVGSTDNAPIPSTDQAVIAFEADTGQERWRHHLGVSQISDPMIAKGVVFVATSDEHGVALNLKDGCLRWREPIGGIYFAAPTLAGNLVLLGSDKGTLMARNCHDGTLAWSFQAKNYGRWSNDFRYPATIVDGTVYITCWNRHCYAIDATSGDVIWISDPTKKRPPMTQPLVTESKVFFAAHDRYIYSLDRGTGERCWAIRLPKYAQVTPVLIENVLYVAAGDHNLYALNPLTGEQLENTIFRTAGRIVHAWVFDGHNLYMVDSRGYLYSFTVRTANAAELEEQGEWKTAAELHELEGDILHAANIYQQKLDMPKKAAEIFEAAGDLLTAAKVYECAGQWEKAAKCYWKMEKWHYAALAYERAVDIASTSDDEAMTNAMQDMAAQAYVHLGLSDDPNENDLTLRRKVNIAEDEHKFILASIRDETQHSEAQIRQRQEAVEGQQDLEDAEWATDLLARVKQDKTSGDQVAIVRRPVHVDELEKAKEAHRKQLEHSERELTTQAHAVAQLDNLSPDNNALVDQEFLLEVGILSTAPQHPPGRILESAPIQIPQTSANQQFEITVYAEDMSVKPLWMQSFTFENDDESDLIQFVLTPNKAGNKRIRVDFYQHRHWLTRINLEVEVVSTPT